MNTYLDITSEQAKAFGALSVDTPLQMLNLLKFKDQVAETGLSGEEQYKAYMKAATPFLQKANGVVLYLGKPKLTLIGPQSLEWDKVLIVEYANKQDFINMSRAEGYPFELRSLALADSRLIFCEPG